MPTPRIVQRVILAIEQSEGVGSRVRRAIGGRQLRNFTPFLMLDHFKAQVSEGSGFPDHPHRGQETISYILHGIVDHEDFVGNSGRLESGDLQFMTAGKGIMHSEMPRAHPDGKPTEGMQLWVDLPKELKKCEPRYRDLRAKEIPNIEVDDGKVKIKVISGKSYGVDSVKDLAYTPVWYLDVEILPGGTFKQELPLGWNAFAYLLSGDAMFDKENETTPVHEFHLVVFEQKGDHVTITVPNGADQSCRLVLIAGQPLDQDIVQYGPFVLTSEQEVMQAMYDYRNYKNGFERARGWESQIGKQLLSSHGY